MFDNMQKKMLKKVGDPNNRNSSTRFSYFTPISFEIEGRTIEFDAKIDTGSPYTIIGTEAVVYKDIREKIERTDILQLSPKSILNNTIPLREYKVNNFTFAEEIVLPNAIVLFSDRVGKRALLGNDIFALFNHGYDNGTKGKATGQGSGQPTYYLLQYEETLEKIKNYVINARGEYIKLHSIADIDKDI